MSKISRNLRAFSWGKFSWTEMICVKKNDIMQLCLFSWALKLLMFVWLTHGTQAPKAFNFFYEEPLIWIKETWTLNYLLSYLEWTVGWFRVKKWVKMLTPLKSAFLSLIINNGLDSVHFGHFLSPRTPGGFRGGLRFFLGGLTPQNCHFLWGTHFNYKM